jgi:hypothetical protein
LTFIRRHNFHTPNTLDWRRMAYLVVLFVYYNSCV